MWAQIFLLLLFLLSAPVLAADNTREVKIKTSAVCNMCKARLERNLGLSKGVKEAVLDVRSKVMTVRFHPGRTSPEELRSVISRTGYDADEIAAVQKAHDKLPRCCRKSAAPHQD